MKMQWRRVSCAAAYGTAEHAAAGIAIARSRPEVCFPCSISSTYAVFGVIDSYGVVSGSDVGSEKGSLPICFVIPTTANLLGT